MEKLKYYNNQSQQLENGGVDGMHIKKECQD